MSISPSANPSPAPHRPNEDQFAYFGYGSLVNRATHAQENHQFSRARLKGWRRQWLARPKNHFGHVALLSIRPDDDCEITGLVVVDHIANLPALDLRERRYDRIKIGYGQWDDLEESATSLVEPTTPMSVYTAKQVGAFEGAEKCRILRSYLDAVMQGYLRKFGEQGLRNFVDTTDNFDIGIREDRTTPVYTRPVTVSRSECILFDMLAPASNSA